MKNKPKNKDKNKPKNKDKLCPYPTLFTMEIFPQEFIPAPGKKLRKS
jgi:hypothetical protein